MINIPARIGIGDKIDISDLLSNYDPSSDVLSNFLNISDSGDHSVISIDHDGGGDSFAQVAMVRDVTGLDDIDTLEANGTLII